VPTNATEGAAHHAERLALLVLLKRTTSGWGKIGKRVMSEGSALTVAQADGVLEQTLFGDGGWGQDVAAAEAALSHWDEQNICVLTVLDAAYPQRLLHMAHPPPVLFLRGRVVPEDEQGIAVIGTRRASPRSLAVAADMAEALAQAGVTVISGLADGVDTAAHTGALRGGGRTVAVIGTGLNRVYPPKNSELQSRLAAEHLVISQFWPDAAPSKASFPMRNELMSAWGRASCVIEADERSGARIQARLAVAQGRELYFHHSMATQPWAQAYVDQGEAAFIASADELLSR
jgi:DNA processing protein